ncbi:PREDICTED: transcription factor MYB98-like [Lupinus angustifolius]|uniref:transcription factor MYB98-like n=1 Tax=Lupinus angustifolius TaxID=3871 RepID=UPI00092FD293|nr:PREDICTED: transcription factor MYB98-like [Lupinus angustifolius]
MQDFQHIDQFHHANASSPNQVFGVQTQNLDPFANVTCGCSKAEFDGYDGKAFVENNGSSSHAHVIDNFQYEGYGLNPHRRSQMNMMASNQSYLPFNPLETKPSNFVAPDEVSCISPAVYYNRIGLNRSNKTSLTTTRSCKVRKKTNIVKGQWTENEDRLLIQLVEQYGVRKWAHVAQSLPSRIGKQCRERWHNHLRPDIKKEVWTDEEDKILIQAHAGIGNKWAEIAKRLPGRTENSIKNHWNATKRRQYSKRKCCSKYPRGTILQDYIKSLNLNKNTPKDYTTQPSSNTMRKKASTIKSAAAARATQPHSTSQVSSNDGLVPNYEFNEDPDFCFHDNMFQDGCSIDSLLDDMPCAPTTNEKDFDAKVLCGSNNKKVKQVVNVDEHNHFETEMAQEVEGNEVQKELDLVSQVNQSNNDQDPGSNYN